MTFKLFYVSFTTYQCGTNISALIVNIFIVLTYYHYISYHFSLHDVLWQLNVVESETNRSSEPGRLSPSSFDYESEDAQPETSIPKCEAEIESNRPSEPDRPSRPS